MAWSDSLAATFDYALVPTTNQAASLSSAVLDLSMTRYGIFTGQNGDTFQPDVLSSCQEEPVCGSFFRGPLSAFLL